MARSNLTGYWVKATTIKEHDEGVWGFFSRGLTSLLNEMTLEVWQGPSTVLLLENSVVSSHRREFVTDGVWRFVGQGDGRDPRPARCTLIPQGVKVETKGLDLSVRAETLTLTSRTTLSRHIEFTTRDGVVVSSSTRQCAKVESEEEMRAGEEVWGKEAAWEQQQALTAKQLLLAGSSPQSTVEKDEKGREREDAPPTLDIPSSPQEPMEVEVWDAPDFSGLWGVDHKNSDSMGEILSMMGVPWLAVKMLSALEVTTEIRHAPLEGSVETTDRSNFGVISSVSIVSNGEPMVSKGKDGRFASMCCTVSEAIPGSFLNKELPSGVEAGPPTGYLRITTTLPDGEGVNDNVWEMRGGGKVMLCFTRFSKGMKMSGQVTRVMTLKSGGGGSPGGRRKTPRSSPSSTAASAVDGSTPPPRGSPLSFPSSSSSSSSSSSPTSGTPTQTCPFFISLQGTWEVQEGDGHLLALIVQGVGKGEGGRVALSKSSPTSSKSSSPKKKASVTVTISHTPQNFSMAVLDEGGASEGGSPPAHFSWALVNGNGLSSPPSPPPQGGGVQVMGGEDPGEMWLGYEVGVLPPVLQQYVTPSSSPSSSPSSTSPSNAPPPALPLLSKDALNSIPGGKDPRLQFFSSTTFDTPRYSSCKVDLHVGAGEPPLCVSGVALPGLLTVTLGGGGHVWVLGKPQHNPAQQGSGASSSSSVGGKEWREERARLGHVRAVILTRRAEADQCRKALLLSALGGGGGEGQGGEEKERGRERGRGKEVGADAKVAQPVESTPSPATSSTGPKKKGGWWGGKK